MDQLLAQLQRANWAYHNTDTPLMTDDEYDRMLEELRRRSPAHPFLSVIGAPPEKGTVLLPHVMGSLDKVRYGEGVLTRWLKKWKPSPNFVITEKLDGLSALYVTTPTKQSLYLRGDGVKGVDVSQALSAWNLPKPAATAAPTAQQQQQQWIIRGEILLPNEAVPEGSIGRSLVNGWLHRDPMPKADLAKCHFVAYQVLEGGSEAAKQMTRARQHMWLKSKGFRTPRMEVTDAALTEDEAKQTLMGWREASVYPLDGIVIGVDQIPLTLGGGEAKNPDDAIAFKAALDEQKEETRIIAVEWNLSRQNLWIPRIQIEPVEIGGATIQWLSGHNAATIEGGELGPGARIIVRRSGDVIPTLDTILEAAPGGASMPEEGSWEWDATRTHAKRKEGAEAGKKEAREKALLHALQTLEVEGIGPGLVKKLVEAGVESVKGVLEASDAKLASALGAGRGPQLASSLRSSLGKASQSVLLQASNLLPRGCGEKKLRTLFSVEPDASRWPLRFNGSIPSGWSPITLGDVLEVLPTALAWVKEVQDAGGIVVAAARASLEAPSPAPASASLVPTPLPAPKGGIVFTNVRDKAWEEILQAQGWEVEDSITKKTLYVIVPEGPLRETTKVKKAKEKNIPILTLSEAKARIA